MLKILLVDLPKDITRTLANKCTALYLSALTLGTIVFMYLHHHVTDEVYTWFVILFTYPITFIVATLLKSILLVKIEAKSMILVHGHMTHFWEEKTWIWRKNFKEYMIGENAELVSYTQTHEEVCVEKNGDPTISCRMIMTRRGTKEAYVSWIRFLNTQMNLRNKSFHGFAEFFLYEFIQEERIALDKLHNPADKVQQEQYQNLLSSFLKDYLNKADFLWIGCGSEFAIVSKSEKKDSFG